MQRISSQVLHEFGEAHGLKYHEQESFPLIEGKLCPLTYAAAYMREMNCSSAQYLLNTGVKYCKECREDLGV